MSDYKFIHDTVHGSIKLEGFALELMETPEIQRLNGIRQLGLSYLVFPGANHTRIEHSLGVYHIAKRIANELNLDKIDRNLVTTAALLHDVGHGPYSHTLENVFHQILKIDHVKLTKDIILGKYDIIGKERRALCSTQKLIPEILEKYDIDAKEVATLVSGCSEIPHALDIYQSKKGRRSKTKSYLAQMIHSSLDCDQMDYLLRDAHYTGVAYGTIDLDRLLQTIGIFNNELVVHEKGISAVESMLVARALMYTSVYFHKTVRIAELMLARAVERSIQNHAEIEKMTDSEVLEWLSRAGAYQNEIVTMLRYRNLFKRLYSKGLDELDAHQKTVLLTLTDMKRRQEKEDTICRRVGIPEGNVIIDIPMPELLFSEPRINKVDLKILVGNRIKPFSKLSPLGAALRSREVFRWVIMVSAPEKYIDKVKKIAEKVLFG